MTRNPEFSVLWGATVAWAPWQGASWGYATCALPVGPCPEGDQLEHIFPRFRQPPSPPRAARPDDAPDPNVSSFLRKTSAQPKIFFCKRGLKVIFLIEDMFGGNVLRAMQNRIFWIS